MIDDAKSILCLLGVVILVVFIPVLILAGFISVAEMNLCNTLVELNPDRSFQWTLFGGCMIKTQEGIWLSMDDITFLDKPIEGVK